MPRIRYKVKLKSQERRVLENFAIKGKRSAREINRARILLLTDEGKTDKEIGSMLGISRGTVINIKHSYSTSKYEHILDLLKEGPRSGAPIKIDGRVEAKAAMIACSKPPEGFGRWTLHLIAEKLVKLDVVESISHESVRSILKKTN